MNTRDLAQDMGRDVAREIAMRGGPLPRWSVDFTSGATGGLSFSRASSANALNSAGSLVTFGTNAPRLDHHPTTHQPRGLLIEEARTNYLLNSLAPASQTVSFATGTYTLWVGGSGNCAVAAGTATGSGFATASSGTPVVFSISGSGTVNFTVSGSLTHFQCENGGFATSLISTAGVAATRANDVAMIDGTGWYNPAEGTLVAEAEAFALSGTQKLLSLQVGTSENDVLAFNITSGTLSFSVRSGNTSVANITLGALSANTLFSVAGAYKVDDFTACTNGGSPGTDTAGAVPAASLSRLYLGVRNGGSTQLINGWIRKVAYYPARLSRQTIQLLTTL